ncbi:type I restriction-modification enzyme R subunit C-terminal domain-containing protein [Deinococcus sp. MIMF12]|uniref:Type I restriction-modification enzyme R subunit C-terminal domain-containing protein n=1 Tax=Deinococcus rhizophilus TaxID=3049544 RepID=A0ABT7JCE0_9DEIO|nr:DEAD/DEAH box helicase family protein [Deinococcus rhizophilus]MDL2342699.1 type I restriction-modification enzyme R subunit C-terminal domain-containing protein [Deinococcus rhizophilus]
MKPEEQARLLIDEQLRAAGWVIQDYRAANLTAADGVVLREVPTAEGPCDYMLFWKRRAVGIVEAKPEGTPLLGVSEQTDKYATGLPPQLRKLADPLPFGYEANGHEVQFRDRRDPDSRSRRVFHFHRPGTLGAWAAEAETLRARLRRLPPLARTGLRDAQFEAITHLEHSLAQGRPRALIQMTMGSGKSYTAVASTYRLLKHARARRVLFLVDRGNLGRQALGEFRNFAAPDDGRRFTELYNVQHLQSNRIDPDAQVVITTIQRLYSILRGEAAFDEGNEERSGFELGGEGAERLVSYQPRVPVETFDFMVADECHRSIYGTWRQVLDYFDAFLTGLTATPDARTIGFFGKNLVMEYGHERAVADGVNVDFDVYRIRTRIGQEGARVAAGEFLDYRDKRTGRLELRQLGDDFDYAASQLDRSVVAVDQIRTVVREYRDRVLPLVFPDRTHTPKTLIFAKNDAHADDIVRIVREEFGKGNDFCKKITYGVTGVSTDTLISQFRNDFNPRVVVTVDMIATGTDIRALEVLLFLRDVKSRSYFDQMKGRGTRVVSADELQKVSSDARHKSFFLLVDAVGVTEGDRSEARPLERQRSVALEKLLHGVGLGDTSEGALSSLAGRLARLDRTLSPAQRGDIETRAGRPMRELIAGLLTATQPEAAQRRAGEVARAAHRPVTPQDVQRAGEDLRDEATAPFADPDLRDLITRTAGRNEVVIDAVSLDEVLPGEHVERRDPADLARQVAEGRVRTFRAFIEAHKDDIDALSILYAQPHARRRVTYRQVKELGRALEGHDQNLQPGRLYQDFATLDGERVRGQAARRQLADLVALVRYATGQAEILEPFGQTVQARFDAWLTAQEAAGRTFTPEQRRWLDLICERVATDLTAQEGTLNETPFGELGGLTRARAVFGESGLRELLEELNEALAA